VLKALVDRPGEVVTRDIYGKSCGPAIPS
jgi:hypothetical protein